MNKRIKELAEQAMATRKHVPPVWQMYDVEMEKFAAFIIKECVDKCRTDWYGDSLDDICTKMFKHFGIKE